MSQLVIPGQLEVSCNHEYFLFTALCRNNKLSRILYSEDVEAVQTVCVTWRMTARVLLSRLAAEFGLGALHLDHAAAVHPLHGSALGADRGQRLLRAGGSHSAGHHSSVALAEDGAAQVCVWGRGGRGMFLLQCIFIHQTLQHRDN